MSSQFRLIVQILPKWKQLTPEVEEEGSVVLINLFGPRQPLLILAWLSSWYFYDSQGFISDENVPQTFMPFQISGSGGGIFMFLKADCFQRTGHSLAGDHVVTFKPWNEGHCQRALLALEASWRFEKCWVNDRLCR